MYITLPLGVLLLWYKIEKWHCKWQSNFSSVSVLVGPALILDIIFWGSFDHSFYKQMVSKNKWLRFKVCSTTNICRHLPDYQERLSQRLLWFWWIENQLMGQLTALMSGDVTGHKNLALVRRIINLKWAAFRG